MTLKPKQKLLGSVLGLCLVGLVIDRQFLGPSEAAADLAPGDYTVEHPGVAAAPAGTPAVARAGLANQLASIAQREGLDLEGVPDAFSPSPSWVPSAATVAEPASNATAGERFTAAHRLTATMAASESGCAIIDGRMLFIGQALDGFTLVEVSERTATFDGQGERLVLAVLEEAAVR